MKLVLFDIDGTLLSSGGAGRRAMRRALSNVFGSWGDPAYRYDGKTDRQIVRDLMRGAGHGDPYIDERMDELFERYLRELAVEMEQGETPPLVLPGVLRLLDELEGRDDVVLGLLTGNIAPGAAVKLRAAGLDVERFRVNAYGSDHESRPELPSFAQRRARDVLGRDVDPGLMVVIGDTPADVHCGQSAGARTVAVATGHYSSEELRMHAPTAVFETLTDTVAVMAVITDA
ncbi:MAG TPA: HAD family hydrolase [Gemmatimonadaceae bacterium]|nr:HAD family hydrolase [Gemmatimonadaceae bacterium]